MWDHPIWTPGRTNDTDGPGSSGRWSRQAKRLVPVPDSAVSEPVSPTLEDASLSTVHMPEEEEGQTPRTARTGVYTWVLCPKWLSPSDEASDLFTTQEPREAILLRELEATRTAASFEISVFEAQAREMENVLRQQISNEAAIAQERGYSCDQMRSAYSHLEQAARHAYSRHEAECADMRSKFVQEMNISFGQADAANQRKLNEAVDAAASALTSRIYAVGITGSEG